MFYTYAHYTPQGRLFYIGKGQGRRAHACYQRGSHWNNIVAKYGKPDVQILSNWDTEAEALDHEVLLISCFRDLGHKLANFTDGGEGISGYKHTEKTKKQMSVSRFGKIGRKTSEETKKKLREINAGKRHSEETKKKLSELNKGLQNSLGYKHSENAKLKITNSLIGNQRGLDNTNRRKWIWIGKNIITGKVVSFAGYNALKDAGFQQSNIVKCINGSIKSHKGYVWHREKWENKK